jgi:hypothetical protein
MIGALITILVIAVLAALVYWVIDQIPVPEPLNRWCKMGVVIVAAIALVILLLNLGGYDTGIRLR